MSAKGAGWPWSALGLDSKATLREVKSAYARRLKDIDHNDPDQFQPLQQAFSAAKSRARSREGKPRQEQPGMAALMGAQPRPAPEPQPESQSKPKPEFTPDIPPETAEQPEQSQPPAPPQPRKPAPKPAKPWGASAEYLDALFETDPWAAQQAFFKRLEAALVWPVDIDKLAQLLEREIVTDLTVKRGAERMVFDTIAENITDYSTPMEPRLAALLDTHFQWSTDGVGLSRRFAASPAFQRVVHCFSASRPSKGTSSFDMDKRPWLAMKIGLLLVVWLMVLSGFDAELTPETAIVTLVVTLVLTSIVRAALVLLSVPIMLIPGLVRQITRLADRIAPNFTADFSRSRQLRVFVYWVVAAVPVAAMFLLT